MVVVVAAAAAAGHTHALTGQGIKRCLAHGQLLCLLLAHVFQRAQPFCQHERKVHVHITGVDNKGVHVDGGDRAGDRSTSDVPAAGDRGVRTV
jgi:hypothetical protein